MKLKLTSRKARGKWVVTCELPGRLYPELPTRFTYAHVDQSDNGIGLHYSTRKRKGAPTGSGTFRFTIDGDTSTKLLRQLFGPTLANKITRTYGTWSDETLGITPRLRNYIVAQVNKDARRAFGLPA